MELNLMQKRIINSRPNGIKIIKGDSGSGKTYAAMKRAFKLQQSYCVGKDDEILILAKDNKHLKELCGIYKNIENKTTIQKSFFDEENKNKLEMNDINSLILLYFSRYNDSHKTEYTIADSKTCEDLIKNAVNKVKAFRNKEYKNVKFLNEDFTAFFVDEIKWIKECGFTRENDYFNADRSSRLNTSYGKDNKLIKMRKGSNSRRCVFQVLNEYNMLLKERNMVDFEDAAFYAVKECKKKKTKKYTHLIVDEVQKFSRIELEIMDVLYNKKVYSSMTFVVDSDKLEQSSGWINKKRKFSSLGYNIKGKTITLKEKIILNTLKSNSSQEKNNKNRRSRRKHIQNTQEECQYNLLNFDILNMSCSSKCAAKDEGSKKILKSIGKKHINKNDNITDFDTIKYIDLNRNVCHELITDFYESGEVYTSDDNFTEKVEDVVNVPVFSEIAAGSPILMNDEVEYSCNIPKSWVRTSGDLFILKIKGDSMVDKNINDGDHVLINKNRYPSANDVVAVEIEGEATLKTFKTKGKQIILKPENDKYDPIILNGEQEFSILGVALGILKNFN